MKNDLIVFMPSIEGGGVEKNLFLICNHLVRHVGSLKVVTISKKYSNRFDKSIKIVTFKSKKWLNLGRRINYFID